MEKAEAPPATLRLQRECRGRREGEESGEESAIAARVLGGFWSLPLLIHKLLLYMAGGAVYVEIVLPFLRLRYFHVPIFPHGPNYPPYFSPPMIFSRSSRPRTCAN